MPFERKNKEMKDLGSSSHCHRNLPWTTAFRNQLKNCISNQSEWSTSNLIKGSVQNEHDTEINRYIPAIKFAKSYNYILIDGNKYRSGTVIVFKIDEEKGPILRQIFKIYEVSGHMYFLLKKVEIDYFNEHHHAYTIALSQKPVTLMHTDHFTIKCSCLLVKVEKLGYFVSTKYRL